MSLSHLSNRYRIEHKRDYTDLAWSLVIVAAGAALLCLYLIAGG